MLTGHHHHRGLGLGTIVSFLMAFTMCPGCGTLRPPETVRTQHDTTTVVQHDSIHLRDSIYVREWVKGDTVYVDRFRDRYLYRDRWRDSIYVKHDTTAVFRTKEVKVEQPLKGWRRFKIGAFWWLLALAAVGWRKQLIWIIRKAAGLFG